MFRSSLHWYLVIVTAYILPVLSADDCSSSCKVIDGHYTVGNIEGPPRIKYPLTHKDVEFTTWVDIMCQLCHSNPPSTLTWIFNEKRLDVNQRHRKLYYFPCEQRLLVKLNDEKDEGNYTCVVRNKLGQANATTEVNGFGQVVQSTDTSPVMDINIEGKISGREVMIGSTINITCTLLHIKKCGGLWVWKKDNQRLSSNERIEWKLISRMITQKNVTRCTSKLTIRNVMIADKGKYECHNIRRVFTPFEIIYLKTITINTVTCFIGYYCPPKDNTAKPCPTGRFSMYKNATSVEQCQFCPTYARKEVLVDLAKVSKTTVENFRAACPEFAAVDCSSSCKVIDGHYTVGNIEGPPRIKYPLTHKDVEFTTWVDITCQLCHSNPPSTLTWIFNEKRLDVNQRHRKLYYFPCEQRLLVKLNDEKDEGSYTCVVRNKLGQANATTEVNGFGQVVQSTDTSPVMDINIEGKISGREVMIGSTINITCTLLHIKKCGGLWVWKKDNQRLSSNERIEWKISRMITQKNVTRCTSKLTIRNVMIDDKGKYECIHNIRRVFTPFEIIYLKTITINTVTCFIGYYCPPKDNTAKPCPTGRFSMYKNATSVEQCQLCPTYARKEVLVDLAKVSKTTVENFRAACPEFAAVGPQKSSGLSRGEKIAIGVSLSVVAIIIVLAVFCGLRSWRGYQKLIQSPHKDIDQIETPIIPRSNHVFVCYSSKNREWVHDTLLANLRAQDFRTFIDFIDFEVGLPIHENIINGIYGSWTTVFVLSKDSLKSFYARTELSQALVASRTTGHQVIVILYEKCKLPAEITKKVYLDWTDEKHRDQFWQKLYRAIKKPLENETTV